MYASKSSSDSINLDFEYSASKNTKRFREYPNSNNKVIEHFLEVTGRETERVRSLYRTRLNISYGPSVSNDNRLLDIYYEGDEKETPLFVFLHGGYWQDLNRNTAGSFVDPLVKRNYRVVVPDYNLCPNITLEELVEQTYTLFEWIFKYAETTKASSISFCGHSAGAHLVSFLLKWNKFQHQSIKIRSLILISGVYDLRELWKLTSINPENILSLDLETARKLSPICWDFNQELVEMLRKQIFKISILVGKNESQTFIGQSLAFYEKIKNLEFQANFQILDNYDHFDILEELSIEDSPIYRYIVEILN